MIRPQPRVRMAAREEVKTMLPELPAFITDPARQRISIDELENWLLFLARQARLRPNMNQAFIRVGGRTYWVSQAEGPDEAMMIYLVRGRDVPADAEVLTRKSFCSAERQGVELEDVDMLDPQLLDLARKALYFLGDGAVFLYTDAHTGETTTYQVFPPPRLGEPMAILHIGGPPPRQRP